jgi:NADH dehydrogenase
VLLLEAGGAVLDRLPEKLSRYAANRLRSKGVDVYLEAMVTEITSDSVRLKDGTVIPTETVIWTAGVQAAPLAQESGLNVNRKRQINVLPTLQAPGHPEVYAVGDSAVIQDEKPLPMIAPVAMQQGEAAAKNIIRQLEGQEPQPFHYDNKGMLAVVGRNGAVADLGRLEFTGFLAWSLWVLVHIYRLIGFRNRLQILINWAWSYILFDRAIRLILPAVTRDNSRVVEARSGHGESEEPAGAAHHRR